MSSFSIMPNSQVDIVDQYTDFLSRELNNELWYVDENDVYNPFLLQQMGVLRASRIQKAVETNGAILYEGLRYTNDTIRKSSREVADRMGQVATGITSSLDRGFTAMHHSLGCINEGIAETNTHLKYLTTATMRGLTALHQEQQVTNHQLQNINQALRVMGSMIGQGFSLLSERLNATNSLLKNILDELRIPETQRERRFHIEEGVKYLAMALKENDKFYYEDAIAEFETAIQIERKDFYSWFSLGFIYLRSVHHINIAKAVDAFERFVHYARAEAIQRNNQFLKLKIDEAYLLMAEAKYLLQNPYEAIQLTERCESNKEKALFMKVKYLSFMGDDGSQQRAADILRDMLQQNPFLSLQVLEDADIIKNKWIVSMLEQLRRETINEAIKQYNEKKQNLRDNGASNYGLQEIANIINRHTYLDAIEALYKIKNFVAYVEIFFDSNGGAGNMDILYIQQNTHQNLLRNSFTHDGYLFVGWNTKADGSGVSYGELETVLCPKSSIVLYAQWVLLSDWIDLGLSVKWKSCNEGGINPFDYGNLYTIDDAISNFKRKFFFKKGFGYLPTKTEWEELKHKCTWKSTWLKVEGNKIVRGYIITGRNGNSIFLPAAGYDDYGCFRRDSGRYWSATKDTALYEDGYSDRYYYYQISSNWCDYNFGGGCRLSVRLVQ